MSNSKMEELAAWYNRNSFPKKPDLRSWSDNEIASEIKRIGECLKILAPMTNEIKSELAYLNKINENLCNMKFELQKKILPIKHLPSKAPTKPIELSPEIAWFAELGKDERAELIAEWQKEQKKEVE